MKFCAHCGAQVSEDAMFCKSCGARLKNDSTDNKTAKPAEPVEKAAAAPAQDAAAPAQDAATPAQDAAAPAQKPATNNAPGGSGEKKTPVIPLVIAGVLIIAIVVITLIKTGKLSPSKTATAESQTVTEAQDVEENEVTVAAEDTEDTENLEKVAEKETEEKTLAETEETTEEAIISKPAVRIQMSEYKQTDGDYNGIEMTGYTTTFDGIDADEGVVWSIESGFQPYTELDSTAVIGTNDGYGYIYCNGVKKIDLNDGSVIWSADACGGSPSWAFDDAGNLYIIGYYDSCLSKVDKDGNVTRSLDLGYYWPYDVQASGDTVSVTYEMPENKTVQYSCSDLSSADTGAYDTGSDTGSGMQVPEEALWSMRRSLNIPDSVTVTYYIGEPYGWEAGGCTLVYVEFYEDGNFVAGASFDANDLEPVKDIMTYPGE